MLTRRLMDLGIGVPGTPAAVELAMECDLLAYERGEC